VKVKDVHCFLCLNLFDKRTNNYSIWSLTKWAWHVSVNHVFLKLLNIKLIVFITSLLLSGKGHKVVILNLFHFHILTIFHHNSLLLWVVSSCCFYIFRWFIYCLKFFLTLTLINWACLINFVVYIISSASQVPSEFVIFLLSALWFWFFFLFSKPIRSPSTNILNAIFSLLTTI